MGKTKQILTFEAPCVYATLVSALAPLSLMKSFVADFLLLTANISASRRVLYCMLLVVSTWSSWPLMVGEYPETTSRKAIIFQKLELRSSSWKHCHLPKLLMLTSGNRGDADIISSALCDKSSHLKNYGCFQGETKVWLWGSFIMLL